MAPNAHLTTSELQIAVKDPARAVATLAHIDECVACRIRFARIKRNLDLEPLADDSLQRVLAAASPLPEGLGELIRAVRDRDPRPGEVWRVGRDEALLVWTRKIFDDGIADVVPLVLDVEMADEESIVIAADRTPLATELTAVVPLRTHIDLRTFINPIGDLDLRKDVNEIMTAMREGRQPSGVHVGSPIEDDNDPRIEYRQALRDLLYDLTPDMWPGDEFTTAIPETENPAHVHISERAVDGDLDGIVELLRERVDGIQCRFIEHEYRLNDDVGCHAVLKVSCLDTTVLVAMVESGEHSMSDLVTACHEMIRFENDVDAFAIATLNDEWPTSLFTTSSLRPAIGLPRGASIMPQAVSQGLHLVDALAKHFDGASTAWDVTEQIIDRDDGWDIRGIASTHAEAALEAIRQTGRRAHQPAKKATWSTIPASIADQVTRFVDAIINSRPMDEALAELSLEDDTR